MYYTSKIGIEKIQFAISSLLPFGKQSIGYCLPHDILCYFFSCCMRMLIPFGHLLEVSRYLLEHWQKVSSCLWISLQADAAYCIQRYLHIAIPVRGLKFKFGNEEASENSKISCGTCTSQGLSNNTTFSLFQSGETVRLRTKSQEGMLKTLFFTKTLLCCVNFQSQCKVIQQGTAILMFLKK